MTRQSTDAAVVEVLLASAALTSVVGQRVWGGSPLPPKAANYDPSQGGAVCAQTIAGRDDYTDLLRHDQVQFKCYAETRAEADTLAGTLHSALQNVRTAKFKWARRMLTARILSEPDTGWIYAFVQYAVMTHQEV